MSKKVLVRKEFKVDEMLNILLKKIQVIKKRTLRRSAITDGDMLESELMEHAFLLCKNGYIELPEDVTLLQGFLRLLLDKTKKIIIREMDNKAKEERMLQIVAETGGIVSCSDEPKTKMMRRLMDQGFTRAQIIQQLRLHYYDVNVEVVDVFLAEERRRRKIKPITLEERVKETLAYKVTEIWDSGEHNLYAIRGILKERNIWFLPTTLYNYVRLLRRGIAITILDKKRKKVYYQ